MTQSHLIVKEEGICIYRMPVPIDMEEVHLSGHSITDAEEHYEELVKQAQSSAILVEDQVKALSLIQKLYNLNHVHLGISYPVPGIEFEPIEKKCDALVCEINSKCCYRKMLDKSTGETLTGCLTKTVARLIEHTAEKESALDTIPKESWKKFEQHYKGESPEIDKEEELWEEFALRAALGTAIMH